MNLCSRTSAFALFHCQPENGFILAALIVQAQRFLEEYLFCLQWIYVTL